MGDPIRDLLARLTWLGHASFRLDASRVIYIDPWQLEDGAPPADLVLVTHSHYDHCSPADVARVSHPGTIVVASVDCRGKLDGDLRTLAPGEALDLEGVRIEAVAAYNPKKKFHPRGAGWNGYVVEVDGVRLYHSGDSDLVPEMKTVRADIALLAVGGTYTMDAEEAAVAAGWIGPAIAVPMHFGRIVGAAADAERFGRLHPGCTVILDPVK